jgi:hypothetical protein
MAHMIGQIYEERMLPKFTIPYFSDNFHTEETWLSSVTFPPLDHGLQKRCGDLPSCNAIPPYNIQHHNHTDGSDIDCVQLTDYINASSKITAITEELPPINRVQCYTHFLEYCLLAYAGHFHHFDKDYFSRVLHRPGSRDPKYFAQWFSYAYPSTKILVGLWTLCYLLRRLKLKWYPPTGFCTGAISFLEV